MLETTPAIEVVLGVRPDEVVGRAVLDLIHPEDRPHCVDAWASLIADPGGVRTVRHRMRTAESGWRWIESTNWNLYTEPGVTAVVCECRDISCPGRGRRRR